MRTSKGNVVVIAIVIAAFLMLVGLVLFYSVSKKQTGYQEPTSNVQTDEQVSALESQSSSDKVSEIDKDLNNTNLDNIDEGVNEANSEASGL
jgi:hypothetical protein